MEYSCNSYKHKRGRIYSTSDRFKYSRIRAYKNVTFLRCVLNRNSIRCHGKAILNEFTNEIDPKDIAERKFVVSMAKMSTLF